MRDRAYWFCQVAPRTRKQRRPSIKPFSFVSYFNVHIRYVLILRRLVHRESWPSRGRVSFIQFRQINKPRTATDIIYCSLINPICRSVCLWSFTLKSNFIDGNRPIWSGVAGNVIKFFQLNRPNGLFVFGVTRIETVLSSFVNSTVVWQCPILKPTEKMKINASRHRENHHVIISSPSPFHNGRVLFRMRRPTINISHILRRSTKYTTFPGHV